MASTPCLASMWDLRLPFLLARWEHSGQRKGFTPVWICMCRSRLDLLLRPRNLLEQMLQSSSLLACAASVSSAQTPTTIARSEGRGEARPPAEEDAAAAFL